MRKLYRADFSVFFISSCESDLQYDARVFAKEELGNRGVDQFKISLVTKSDQVPAGWLKAIPYGDDTLTEGEGITISDILEEQVTLLLAGLNNDCKKDNKKQQRNGLKQRARRGK